MTEEIKDKKNNGVYINLGIVRSAICIVAVFSAFIVWLANTHSMAFANKSVNHLQDNKIDKNTSCVATITGELTGIKDLLNRINLKLG